MLYNIQVIYNYYNVLIYTNLPQKPLRCASIICEVLKTTKAKVCLLSVHYVPGTVLQFQALIISFSEPVLSTSRTKLFPKRYPVIK